MYIGGDLVPCSLSGLCHSNVYSFTDNLQEDNNSKTCFKPKSRVGRHTANKSFVLSNSQLYLNTTTENA